MRWLVIVVVVAIIAFVGYRYVYEEQGEQIAEQAGQAAEEAAQQVEETTQEAAQAVEQAGEEAAEAVEGAANQAADTAEQAAGEAADTAEQAAGEATEATGQAAGEAAETIEPAAGEATDTAQQAGESAAGAAEESLAALTVGGVDLGQEIGTTVSDATSALEGITDKASAEAALPSLQAVQTKLDKLGGTVDQLPQQAKEALASLLDDSLPELKDLANKVEGIEGASEVVKPTLDGIMTKLDAWAKQPA
jgi:hypothetical protein